jgi:hypothetical protein
MAASALTKRDDRARSWTRRRFSRHCWTDAAVEGIRGDRPGWLHKWLYSGLRPPRFSLMNLRRLGCKDLGT